MHVEDQILGSASTVPADMTVSEKNVLSHVPEPKLVALLIARALDFGILDLLNVEGCGFNHDLGDRKHSANRFNARDVRLNAILHGRCKPSLVLRSNAIVEAWFAVARLAIAPCASESQTVGKKSRDVLSKLDFGREDLLLFRRSGNADILGACIDAQRHVLLRLACGDGQLIVNGVRRATTALPAFSMCLAFAGEHGISGLPRMFKTKTFKVSPLRIPAGSACSARRPVDILRQCWKGFLAGSTAPTSQSF